MTQCVPDYTVTCTTAPNIGDRTIIPGFCGPAGPAGTALRVNACNSLGLPGEFGNENEVNNGCFYQAGNPGNSCGGVVGRSVSCQRLNYGGNVQNCCLNPGSCIDPVTGKGTCDPQARGYTGTQCQQFFLSYCSSPATLEENWAPNGVCTRVLEANSLSGNNAYVSELGNNFLSAFFGRNELSQPGSATFNPFQDRVLNICQQNPLACNSYLQNNLCTSYSRVDLSTSFPDLQKFCGCQLPLSEYNTFLNNQGGVSLECDGLCNTATTVKRVDPVSGKALTCSSNVCIIDDVTINLIESNVGNISFGQVCGGCAGGSCVCLTKDISITGSNSTIGNINFEQNCTTTTCYQTKSDGTIVEVPCGTIAEQEESAENTPTPTSNRTLIIILVILAVIVFLLFIIGAVVVGLRRKRRTT